MGPPGPPERAGGCSELRATHALSRRRGCCPGVARGWERGDPCRGCRRGCCPGVAQGSGGAGRRHRWAPQGPRRLPLPPAGRSEREPRPGASGPREPQVSPQRPAPLGLQGWLGLQGRLGSGRPSLAWQASASRPARPVQRAGRPRELRRLRVRLGRRQRTPAWGPPGWAWPTACSALPGWRPSVPEAGTPHAACARPVPRWSMPPTSRTHRSR